MDIYNNNLNVVKVGDKYILSVIVTKEFDHEPGVEDLEPIRERLLEI